MNQITTFFFSRVIGQKAFDTNCSCGAVACATVDAYLYEFKLDCGPDRVWNPVRAKKFTHPPTKRSRTADSFSFILWHDGRYLTAPWTGLTIYIYPPRIRKNLVTPLIGCKNNGCVRARNIHTLKTFVGFGRRRHIHFVL